MRRCAIPFVGGAIAFAAAVTAQATARVEGLVVDPHSRPVANAEVTAEVDGVVVARARSDGSGVFLLPRLVRAQVVVRVLAAGPDFGAAAVDLRPRATGVALVRTVPVRSVVGRVRGADGSRVAGAWVACAPKPVPAAMRLLARNDGPPLGTRTLSDAEGRFVLPHVPCGPVLVRVWAVGHGGFAGTVDGSGAAELDGHLAPPAEASLRFELCDADDRDRAAARLVVHEPNGVPLPPELRAPPHRQTGFELMGWPAGEALVGTIELPGTFVEPRRVQAVVGQRVAGRFWCEYGAATRVRGRVLAADGGPAAGVTLRVGVWTPSDLVTAGAAVTQADGRFDVVAPVSRGKPFLLRVDEEHGALAPAPDAIERLYEPCPDGAVRLVHRPDDELTLSLAPRATLTARIVDADGQPVACGAVEVFAARRFAMVRGVRGMPGVQLPGVNVNVAERLATGHTRADGTVVVSPFATRGSGDVTLRVAGGSGFVLARAPADQDLGALRVGAAATLRGRVLDAAGQPVAGGAPAGDDDGTRRRGDRGCCRPRRALRGDRARAGPGRGRLPRGRRFGEPGAVRGG
jgi:hypothetical protein